MQEQDNSSPEETIPTHKQFPIVGIGASAGGLDAFKRFLKAVPIDTGMSFVVVQHLDPAHESFLPELLAKVTNIPVLEITDEIKLVPDHIYVIPSNKTLTSTDGILKLTPRINPNLVIDKFFKSLAEVHQSFAVGIVLSGTGMDGTIGLRHIKAHGGITFAQDESSAYDSMPQSAIAADVVDFILAPEKIPQELLKIDRTYKGHYLDPAEMLSKQEAETLQQIISMLRLRSGVDFTYYKQTTIRRRLARRMAISGKEKLGSYLILLQKDKGEVAQLYQDLLIPVTSFFRDTNTFKTLSETIFASLLKNKDESEPIRIWSAACSTGEEAYSLAISIHEFLSKNGFERQVQIFGSDLSEPGIAKARAGNYSQSDVDNVSEQRLKNYFIRNKDGYQVSRLIRDMCVFAVHNFLKDPPFAKMDLVSCRNVLIYMDTILQKKAMSIFHYALKDLGFLLLGKSESTGSSSELFSDFIKPDRIYSRKAALSRFIPTSIELKEKDGKKLKRKVAKQEAAEPDFRKDAQNILLSLYTPANVIVNDNLDIVHINGSINSFLEPSQGAPTFNLIKMARGGLAFELRNAVHKARSAGATVIKENIPVEFSEKAYTVTIEVVPLTNTAEAHFLILFRKVVTAESTGVDTDGQSGSKNDEAYARIEQLEKELAQAREDMLSITDEQESSNEELQSANEELLSGSEELQSLNEELETTKEEVQSSNEELIVVNHELLEKQEQLNRARLYAEAIIQTIREPLVILDKEFRIKTADASFYKKFNLTEKETEGKLFFEISDGLWDIPMLRSMLEKILPKKSRLDDFEIIMDFPHVGKCTMLLNARQVINEPINEELILLAIEDITEKKLAEQRQKSFSEELEIKVKERTTALEQSNQQLEQFSHTASHEFQEPLRKIVTFSNYLQFKYDKAIPEELKKHLNKIEAASIRMAKLIKDMLDFANVTNHDKLFEKTDLNKICADILFDFELLVQEKKAEITVGELPEIEAIPFQMNQLFYDLIGNAIKFTKTGVTPQIHISSKKLIPKDLKSFSGLDPKKDYVELIFKDNGIGFDQKHAHQIFIMFQRLHNGTQYPGTGIGLALCKKIVQGYLGEIFAEAIENEGATFRVILPIEQAAPSKRAFSKTQTATVIEPVK